MMMAKERRRRRRRRKEKTTTMMKMAKKQKQVVNPNPSAAALSQGHKNRCHHLRHRRYVLALPLILRVKTLI
jgi:hypothetical protein